ncbi:hypothetical protein DR864_04785 [Runella rosea]|uniref:Uncharacterized protein n=1 Tax=Runella rosea TaxID=2259595 RepID=A0A344TEM8_9BACT|nr:hypothetical protein [Runella rosea]AXE17099.1 hypothetical protein DR864_04785 [Runella rosea]
MATKKNDNDINGGEEFPGYPLYPASEDIYNQATKEGDLDPEDLTHRKSENDGVGEWNEKDFEDDISGGDLDIPGAELDDDLEAIGSEDEENNYYSLGGDNHIDLEEQNDE